MNKIVRNKYTHTQSRSAGGQFQAIDEPMGSPVCVALPLAIDEAVRELENRSAWLRRVIVEAAQRELIGNTNTN